MSQDSQGFLIVLGSGLLDMPTQLQQVRGVVLLRLWFDLILGLIRSWNFE
jgi:hypothetical protein